MSGPLSGPSWLKPPPLPQSRAGQFNYIYIYDRPARRSLSQIISLSTFAPLTGQTKSPLFIKQKIAPFHLKTKLRDFVFIRVIFLGFEKNI
jgi:hypothetical protein